MVLLDENNLDESVNFVKRCKSNSQQIAITINVLQTLLFSFRESSPGRRHASWTSAMHAFNITDLFTVTRMG